MACRMPKSLCRTGRGELCLAAVADVMKECAQELARHVWAVQGALSRSIVQMSTRRQLRESLEDVAKVKQLGRQCFWPQITCLILVYLL